MRKKRSAAMQALLLAGFYGWESLRSEGLEVPETWRFETPLGEVLYRPSSGEWWCAGEYIAKYRPRVFVTWLRKAMKGEKMDANKYALVVQAIGELVEESHGTAKRKGFYENDNATTGCIATGHIPGVNPLECAEAFKVTAILKRLMLIVTEVAELAEVIRRGGDPPAEHIAGDGFSQVDEEMADIAIRLFDLCGYLGVRLGPAIVSKMEYNSDRPYLHGKKV